MTPKTMKSSVSQTNTAQIERSHTPVLWAIKPYAPQNGDSHPRTGQNSLPPVSTLDLGLGTWFLTGVPSPQNHFAGPAIAAPAWANDCGNDRDLEVGVGSPRRLWGPDGGFTVWTLAARAQVLCASRPLAGGNQRRNTLYNRVVQLGATSLANGRVELHGLGAQLGTRGSPTLRRGKGRCADEAR